MTSPVLIDPSAVLAILFDDEDDAYARGVLDHAARHGSAVPYLFWYEIKHVMIKGIRHERTTRARADEQAALLRGLVASTVADPTDRAVMDAAERGNLSGYDAVYAAVAARDGLSLATLDASLKRAANPLRYDLWQSS